MNNILDRAVKQGEEQKKLSQADLERIFAASVTAKLEPLVILARHWLKEIAQYVPVATQTVQKILKSPYRRDLVVARLCDELSGLSKNTGTIQQGLAEYAQLKPRDLLKVINNQEVIDVNAAPNIVPRIRGLLQVGQGCKGQMEKLVEQIELRVKFLMEAGIYNQSLMPQTPEPQAMIVPPSKGEDGPLRVISDFNSREV